MALLNVISVSSVINEYGLDLPDILSATLLRNARLQLRSMFLFSGGNIMQVLEGAHEAVNKGMQEIARDGHFVELLELNRVTVDEPRLQTNSLGAGRLSASVLERLPADLVFFPLGASAVEQRVRPGVACNLLAQFARDYS